MVNQHHALIFNEKKGETVIGVLVKVFIFFIFIFNNYLVKVEVA